jgi:hypothetical protein
VLALWARQADDDALAIVPEKLTRCAWHSRTVVGTCTASNDARRAAVPALAGVSNQPSNNDKRHQWTQEDIHGLFEAGQPVHVHWCVTSRVGFGTKRPPVQIRPPRRISEHRNGWQDSGQ